MTSISASTSLSARASDFMIEVMRNRPCQRSRSSSPGSRVGTFRHSASARRRYSASPVFPSTSAYRSADPAEIIRDYAERLLFVHVKDWLVTDPDIGLESWSQRSRF